MSTRLVLLERHAWLTLAIDLLRAALDDEHLLSPHDAQAEGLTEPLIWLEALARPPSCRASSPGP